MSQIDFSLLPEADYSSLTFGSYDPEEVTTEKEKPLVANTNSASDTTAAFDDLFNN